MKAIPNILSISRLAFSMLLYFLKPLGTAFYAVYILCGLSDMLDGPIARKTGTVSSLGAKLDSLADLALAAALLYTILPALRPPVWVFIWILAICLIRFGSVFISLIRFKTFSMLHTYGNKGTGLFLFLFPTLLLLIPPLPLMTIACILASLSALEECLLQLTAKKLNPDRRSIFTCERSDIGES